MQQKVIEGYRLSPQQEYLWLLGPHGATAYRTQCALRLEGELQKSFLKEALQQVVEQHEILRTAFRAVPGMSLPLQVILEQGPWSWREVDLSELAEGEQSSQLAALEWSESQRAFNHEQGKVLYACLVILTADKHILYLNVSPMCADSWSMQNLVRELGHRYTARLSGAEVALEAVQYADYSEWQHELLNTESSEGRDFWRKQHVSDMPVLKLPLENSGGAAYQPQYITLKSDAELVEELEALARASDVSLSVLLLAAWSSLLWRLTGERELVVGVAVDGSRYKELHESLGLFTKYLPAPLRFAATSSFQEIIKRVASSYREAYDWQEYYAPGEGRAAEEGMGYEFEEREETVAGYGPLRVEVINEESCRSRQRLLLQCRYQRVQKRLELRLRYDGGCYSPEVMKLLAERLETWLHSVMRAPRAELDVLKGVAPEEEEATAALSEARSGNGTARLWRESLAQGVEAAEVSEAELRRYLRERLPEYMVPQVLVKLERMPLTQHGKIDYRKLPPLEEIGSMTRANYVTPRNETERVIAAVCERLLNVEHVSIADNFFDLGGHSMTLVQLRRQIQEALGRDIPLVEIFRHPTVAALANYINGEMELDSMEEAQQRALKRVAALQRQRT